MKIFFALILSLFAPSIVSAQKAVRFKDALQKSLPPRDDFKAIFYLSQDYRFERNENMGYSPHRLMSLGFGLRYREKFLGLFEGGSFNDTTGVGNVRVERKFETINLSAAMMTQAWGLAPYVGAGIGMARDTSNVVIEISSSESRGGWEPISHFFGGVRFFPRTMLWASLEAKFVVGPRLDPNPTPGVLLRIGAEL